MTAACHGHDGRGTVDPCATLASSSAPSDGSHRRSQTALDPSAPWVMASRRECDAGCSDVLPRRAANTQRMLSAPEGETIEGYSRRSYRLGQAIGSRLVGAAATRARVFSFIVRVNSSAFLAGCAAWRPARPCRTSPRGQQAARAGPPSSGAQRELPRAQDVASLEFTLATGDHLRQALPVGRCWSSLGRRQSVVHRWRGA